MAVAECGNGGMIWVNGLLIDPKETLVILGYRVYAVSTW